MVNLVRVYLVKIIGKGKLILISKSAPICLDSKVMHVSKPVPELNMMAKPWLSRHVHEYAEEAINSNEKCQWIDRFDTRSTHA